MMRTHQHTRRPLPVPQGRSAWLARLPQAIIVIAIIAIVAYAGWAFQTLSFRAERFSSVAAPPPSVRLVKSIAPQVAPDLGSKPAAATASNEGQASPSPHAPSPLTSPPPPPSVPPPSPSPPPPSPPPPSPPPPSPPPPSPSPLPPSPPPPSPPPPSPPPPSTPTTQQQSEVGSAGRSSGTGGSELTATATASTSTPSLATTSTSAASADHASAAASKTKATVTGDGPDDEPYTEDSDTNAAYVSDDPGSSGSRQGAGAGVAARTSASSTDSGTMGTGGGGGTSSHSSNSGSAGAAAGGADAAGAGDEQYDDEEDAGQDIELDSGFDYEDPDGEEPVVVMPIDSVETFPYNEADEGAAAADGASATTGGASNGGTALSAAAAADATSAATAAAASDGTGNGTTKADRTEGPGDDSYNAADVSTVDVSYASDDPASHAAQGATGAAAAGAGAGTAATAEAGAAGVVVPAGGGAATGRELLPATAVSGRMGRSSGAQLTRPAPGGTLFSWGLQEWRLGKITGDASVPEPALNNLTVISVAASRHSAIVAMDGVVWTMGHNDSKGGGGHGSPPLDASGQLGRGGTKQPGPVGGPLAGKFVVQAVVGRYHTMAVTEDGQLYSWGLNDWGQLGRSAVGATSPTDPSPCTSGPSCHSGTPAPVIFQQGTKIVGAAAGRYVSMAVDDQGRLYTWGHDGCSNGGKLPSREDAYKPRLVKGELAGKRVVAFDAGYLFWLAATDQGEVYTCDTQDDGYAGTLTKKREPNEEGELGRAGDPLVPGKVGGVLVGQKVEAVAAGREHAVVSTADGRVFTWGGRDLLIGRSGNKNEPGQAQGELLQDDIRFVAAGEYHSSAASATTVYGWGSNDYLCTGVGRMNPVQNLKDGEDRGDVLRPAKALGVLAAGGWQVQAMVAGFQHVLAIAANKGGSWSMAEIRDKSLGLSAGTKTAAADATASSKTQGTSATDNASRAPNAANVAEAAEAAAAEAAAGSVDATTTTTAAAATTAATTAAATTASKTLPYTDTSASDYHTRYLAPQLHLKRFNVSQYVGRFRRSERFDLIQAESPDVWKVLPPGYDPRYKNPCWMQGERLRCIPYYHILGVSKCGTTDLYHRLSKHPQMFESRNKGPHWWDECPYPPKGACTAPPNGDFDGYVDLFADAAESIRRSPEGITGEASSNTFTSAAGVYLRGPSMDRNTTVTMPELMREATPFQHNIIIFRNPIDRYYSAFYYYRWWIKDQPTPGPEDFHKSVKDDLAIWKACVEEHGQKYCVRHYHPQQLIKGMYSEFIMDWLAHWPRDQLLFLRNEDYSATPRDHMEAVFKFLDMRQPTDQEWQTIMGMETRNKQTGKYKPMLPETRTLLQEFYRPFNERLSQILSDDRWLWRDPPKGAKAQGQQQQQPAGSAGDAAAQAA